MMADKYDRAIAYLTEHPEEIADRAWGSLEGLGAPLFRFVTPTGDVGPRADGYECGCLTTIRGSGYVAWTDELTTAIRADYRIPLAGVFITPADLEVFAAWQRRIDLELGRRVED